MSKTLEEVSIGKTAFKSDCAGRCSVDVCKVSRRVGGPENKYQR